MRCTFFGTRKISVAQNLRNWNCFIWRGPNHQSQSFPTGSPKEAFRKPLGSPHKALKKPSGNPQEVLTGGLHLFGAEDNVTRQDFLKTYFCSLRIGMIRVIILHACMIFSFLKIVLNIECKKMKMEKVD